MKRPTRVALILVVILLGAGELRAESFASWMRNAQKAERKKDHAAAIECYAQALSLWTREDGNAARKDALSSKAAHHAAVRQWLDAIRDLTTALALAPKDKTVLFRRGQAYLESGKPKAAITDFYKAIALDPGFKEAYYQRARAYERSGDARFAKEDYAQACELGVEAACRKAKPGRAPAAPGRAFPAAPAPSEAPAQDATGFLNASSCLDFLSKCESDGDSYGTCVERLAPCERNPASGCCPQACKTLFHKVQEEQGLSEAFAFREVFRPDSPCLKK